METFQVEAKRYFWKPELKDKLFYFVLCPLLLLVSALWFLLTALLVDQWLLIRASGIVLLLAAILICFKSQCRQKKTLILVFWAVFMITRISPVEVSIENYPGPPHFVRLTMGEIVITKPMSEEEKRAWENEVMLGGCLVNPYRCEPKWVLVW